MNRPAAQFVVCIKNENYPVALELRKLYQVIPDESAARLHQVRVIDESGGDYLYPEEYFVAVQIPQSAEKVFMRAANVVAAK